MFPSTSTLTGKRRIFHLQRDQHDTVDIRIFPRLKQVINHQHGKEEDNHLKVVEIQGHRLLHHHPPQHHQEGHHKERDLQDAADDDADRGIDVSVPRSCHDGGPLGAVAGNGDQDGGDKGFAHPRDVGCLVDVFEQEVRAAHDSGRCGEEKDASGGKAQAGRFLLLGRLVVVIMITCRVVVTRHASRVPLVFDEQMRVGSQVEVKVSGVENEEDYRGAMREGHDLVVNVQRRIRRAKRRVENCGKNQCYGGDDHQ